MFLLQVMVAMSAQLIDDFYSNFNVNDPDFNWEKVLEWEIPETDCPESADDTVRVHTCRSLE